MVDTAMAWILPLFFLKNNFYIFFWVAAQSVLLGAHSNHSEVFLHNSDRVTQSGGGKGLGIAQKIPRWFKMACKVEKLWGSGVDWPHLGLFTNYGCLGPTPRDFHIIALSLGVRLWKAP